MSPQTSPPKRIMFGHVFPWSYRFKQIPVDLNKLCCIGFPQPKSEFDQTSSSLNRNQKDVQQKKTTFFTHAFFFGLWMTWSFWLKKTIDDVISVGIDLRCPRLQRNCERSIFVSELQVFWQRKACRNSVEHHMPFQQKQPILVRFWWRILPFFMATDIHGNPSYPPPKLPPPRNKALIRPY